MLNRKRFGKMQPSRIWVEDGQPDWGSSKRLNIGEYPLMMSPRFVLSIFNEYFGCNIYFYKEILRIMSKFLSIMIFSKKQQQLRSSSSCACYLLLLNIADTLTRIISSRPYSFEKLSGVHHLESSLLWGFQLFFLTNIFDELYLCLLVHEPEKDYVDRKVIYHIPIEYADQYDLDNVDETMFDQPVKPRIARVKYRPYETTDADDYYYEYEQPDYERVQYVEQPTPRQRHVVRRAYVNDDWNRYNDQSEYVVKERSLPTEVRYVYQRPIRRAVYVLEEGDPSITTPSPRAISQLQRPIIDQQSLSKPLAIRRYRIKTPVHYQLPPEAPQTIKSNNQTYVRATDIILANRAKRRIEEEKYHDPPQRNKTIIKNNFIVHK
ncbi:unnamed protein product [Didymodactylos carnosus]|uniref:Uncharacterized protein n=1 Tax=Didymodactylos carnosus TaxID=1234261 RepID=A0A813ZCM3_9BILA|nr:unnamed protein product [Didymodactylos carnosus]CAF3681136.1 unnamed protein product [Didymodactylos carnosus]